MFWRARVTFQPYFRKNKRSDLQQNDLFKQRAKLQTFDEIDETHNVAVLGDVKIIPVHESLRISPVLSTNIKLELSSQFSYVVKSF